jgi:hypothetical protein
MTFYQNQGNSMKKISFVLLCMAAFAGSTLADVPSPNKKPKPTPQSTVTNTKTPDPTPAPGPKPEKVHEAQMTVSLSNWSDGPTLVITKAMVEKINAAARDKGMETAATTGGISSFASTQTIAGGILLSLAFVFGGVWLARSRGNVSKPAMGVLLMAVVGMGTMLVTGNVPPPKRITLSSNIFNEQTLKNFVAAGKVKIMIVDYDTKDEISLIIPRQTAGTGDTEE